MCLQKSIVGIDACVYTGGVSENVMWLDVHAHTHIGMRASVGRLIWRSKIGRSHSNFWC